MHIYYRINDIWRRNLEVSSKFVTEIFVQLMRYRVEKEERNMIGKEFFKTRCLKRVELSCWCNRLHSKIILNN